MPLFIDISEIPKFYILAFSIRRSLPGLPVLKPIYQLPRHLGDLEISVDRTVVDRTYKMFEIYSICGYLHDLPGYLIHTYIC